jgi:hypothetical protein
MVRDLYLLNLILFLLFSMRFLICRYNQRSLQLFCTISQCFLGSNIENYLKTLHIENL